MIQSISMDTSSTSNKLSISFNIECHPAWQGELSFEEISFLLQGQIPFTFVLTNTQGQKGHLLSYINQYNTLHHIVFKKDETISKWCYTNGCENEFHQLDEMIKHAMHCEEMPIPLSRAY